MWEFLPCKPTHQNQAIHPVQSDIAGTGGLKHTEKRSFKEEKGGKNKKFWEEIMWLTSLHVFMSLLPYSKLHAMVAIVTSATDCM
jgi:hypothetical protein